MGLASLFEWGQEQVKYVLYIVLFIALIVTGFRRAWIAMIGAILGLAFVAIFIDRPETISSLGDWFNALIRLGKK